MFREYIERLAVCAGGLALCALGMVFGVLAGSAGTNGWNSLAIGLSNVFGFSFGTGVFTVSAALLLTGYIGKGKIGIGTVLVMALQASFFQFACHVCRFVPREVPSEDLADTWRRIRSGGDK